MSMMLLPATDLAGPHANADLLLRAVLMLPRCKIKARRASSDWLMHEIVLLVSAHTHISNAAPARRMLRADGLESSWAAE